MKSFARVMANSRGVKNSDIAATTSLPNVNDIIAKRQLKRQQTSSPDTETGH